MERHSFRVVSGESPETKRNCALPQNFHTRKLGEITLFYAVIVTINRNRSFINNNTCGSNNGRSNSNSSRGSRKSQKSIQNPVKHLRWGDLRK